MLSLNKFIKFKKGTIPLILSVPHGGILEFDEIPIRQNGVLGIDKGTIELAERLVSYIKKFSNKPTPKHICPIE